MQELGGVKAANIFISLLILSVFNIIINASRRSRRGHQVLLKDHLFASFLLNGRPAIVVVALRAHLTTIDLLASGVGRVIVTTVKLADSLSRLVKVLRVGCLRSEFALLCPTRAIRFLV